MAEDLPALLLNERRQQLVTFALVIAFQIIMSPEFHQASLQRTFAQQNQLCHALLFHRSNPAFRIGVQVRALGRKQDRVHTCRGQTDRNEVPLSPGRAERHGFEYYRHGTLSLYAALDVKTGEVHGMTAARHTAQQFISFLNGLVERAEWAQEIHVVLDNLSAHKTKDVERFLAEHPQVQFHFTPTYSSWLNQVELWFAKIQRDVITRGVFTSVADLGNKLRKYIRAYSKSARPFRWTYTDTNRRIRPNKIAGTAY